MKLKYCNNYYLGLDFKVDLRYRKVLLPVFPSFFKDTSRCTISVKIAA